MTKSLIKVLLALSIALVFPVQAMPNVPNKSVTNHVKKQKDDVPTTFHRISDAQMEKLLAALASTNDKKERQRILAKAFKQHAKLNLKSKDIDLTKSSIRIAPYNEKELPGYTPTIAEKDLPDNWREIIKNHQSNKDLPEKWRKAMEDGPDKAGFAAFGIASFAWFVATAILSNFSKRYLAKSNVTGTIRPVGKLKDPAVSRMTGLSLGAFSFAAIDIGLDGELSSWFVPTVGAGLGVALPEFGILVAAGSLSVCTFRNERKSHNRYGSHGNKGVFNYMGNATVRVVKDCIIAPAEKVFQQ